MKSTCVDLLLATYNGARHLGAQLDSLLAQTHQDFRLLVSDDGSTDGTLALLESYGGPQFVEKHVYPQTIKIPVEGLANAKCIVNADAQLLLSRLAPLMRNI